ncbi:hypothetical protein [Serratia inhibens]|uniref:hypothetical protein n=1 Tax=Serratia inhibens TaxID=2338073 RepID=UPI0032176359
MALSDVQVRSAKREEKAYKLTDGDGMVLLVHPQATLGRTYLYFKNERTQNIPVALFLLNGHIR